jgi:hypothetical protein
LPSPSLSSWQIDAQLKVAANSAMPKAFADDLIGGTPTRCPSTTPAPFGMGRYALTLDDGGARRHAGHPQRGPHHAVRHLSREAAHRSREPSSLPPAPHGPAGMPPGASPSRAQPRALGKSGRHARPRINIVSVIIVTPPTAHVKDDARVWLASNAWQGVLLP